MARPNLKDQLLYGGGGDPSKSSAIKSASGGTVVVGGGNPSSNKLAGLSSGLVTSAAFKNALNKGVQAVEQSKAGAEVTKSVSGSGGNASSGNSGYSVDYGYSAPASEQKDYYDELMAAIDAQTKARREAQIAALDAQLKQGLSDYDAQIGALDPVYQQYRNQSEVERYKAQNALRESLANRGALDSGAGRQETLDLQTNYGNNLNAINLQYQNELDALNRAKQSLNDGYAAQKIQIESDVENVGLEAKIAAIKEQLAAEQEAARQAAASVAAASYSSGGSSGTSSTKRNSSSATLSSNGSAFLNSMKQRAAMSGREHTAYEVETALRSGYEQGVLNENDVRIIKASYGY